MSADVPALVLALVDDLLFASRIEAEVQHAGASFQRIATSQALIEAVSVERPSLIIVDLEGMGFDGVAALTSLLQEPRADGVPRLAYGSHVDAGRLAAAESAGAVAMPRSRFVRELGAEIAKACEG